MIDSPGQAVSGACPTAIDPDAAVGDGVSPVTPGARDGATHDFEGRLAAAWFQFAGKDGITVWIR